MLSETARSWPSTLGTGEMTTWNLLMSRGLPAFFRQFWLHLRKNFKKNLQHITIKNELRLWLRWVLIVPWLQSVIWADEQHINLRTWYTSLRGYFLIDPALNVIPVDDNRVRRSFISVSAGFLLATSAKKQRFIFSDFMINVWRWKLLVMLVNVTLESKRNKLRMTKYKRTC